MEIFVTEPACRRACDRDKKSAFLESERKWHVRSLRAQKMASARVICAIILPCLAEHICVGRGSDNRRSVALEVTHGQDLQAHHREQSERNADRDAACGGTRRLHGA